MKIFEGIVISIGMNKTVVVEVTRRTPHPLYKKLIKRSKKIKADTASFTPAVGSIVKIIETRPISKDKYFKITKILGETTVKKAAPAIDDVLEEIKSVKKISANKSSVKKSSGSKSGKEAPPSRKTRKGK